MIRIIVYQWVRGRWLDVYVHEVWVADCGQVGDGISKCVTGLNVWF